MSSNQSIVDYILDQIASAGTVSAKKMFGEYAIYCDGKVVALVCDDKLFVKPTPAGKVIIGDCEESAPYQGAKFYFVIDEDRWDDSEWLTQLIKATAISLPMPKPKRVKKK